MALADTSPRLITIRPSLPTRIPHRRLMREHEEFEVETDRAGELPMPFWSETVRRVVLE